MSDEHQDASTVVVSTQDCPECRAKKKFVTYADGHALCFNKGCGYKVGQQPAPEFTLDAIPKGLLKPDGLSWNPVRGLAVQTMRRYGSFLAGHKGDRRLVTPVYDNTGTMVGQQVRMQDGQVDILGDRNAHHQLYGQHVYGDRYDRKVVIHSDALDAMSTAQVGRLKFASVGLLTGKPGDAATREIKENYRWVDRFTEIILFFQDSPEWQETAQNVAALFEPGKVKIARLGEYRSPNEALLASRPGDIESAVWSATPWRPVGIVNAKDGRDLLFKEGLQVPSWPYPWPEFNAKLLGIRPGECIYHVGGTGIAKTTLMFHYAVHLLKWDGKPFLADNPTYPVQAPCKIGWMGFEDLTKQVKVGMLGIHAGKMLALEAIEEKEGLALFDNLFGDGRLELYDPEQAEYGLEAVLSYARYMRRALDCRIIFFDPLSFIVSQLPVMSRTQEEEKLAGRLAAEAKALGVSFQIGYHLKKPDGTPFEEGAEIGISDIKGSGALTHFAHGVMGYERDQQGDRPDLLRVRSLKNRYARFTGEVCVLKYDYATGRYTPTSDVMEREGDNKGKGGGFGTVSPKNNKSQDY